MASAFRVLRFDDEACWGCGLDGAGESVPRAGAAAWRVARGLVRVAVSILPLMLSVIAALAVSTAYICSTKHAHGQPAGDQARHVTTFNSDDARENNPHPQVPLEDYGFVLHSRFTSDLEDDLAGVVKDIEQSRMLYFGQWYNPTYVLRHPECVTAARGLLRRGGTIVFDYCAVDGPQTIAFFKAVGVDLPEGYEGGMVDVEPSKDEVDSRHPFLRQPTDLQGRTFSKSGFGSWGAWSKRQTAPLRVAGSGRAAMVVQSQVEGSGTVVMNRVFEIFRKDFGPRGEPFKNIMSYVSGAPVGPKTLIPVVRRFVSTSPLAVWGKPRYAVFPQEPDAPQTRAITGLACKAAINERISTAFLLTAAKEAPQEVGIHVGGLDREGGGASIPAERIELRELQFFHDYTDRLIPDPMPAVSSLAIPAGETRQVWLTIDTTGAAAGSYRGEVRLTTAGMATVSLPIRLEVWPIVLPTDNPLKFCTWDYVPSAQRNKDIGGWGNWKHYHDDLVEHGVNVFPVMSFNHPQPVVDEKGNLTKPLDFKTFDVEFFTKDKGQIYLISTPRVFAGELKKKLGVTSPAWENMMRGWLKAVIAHLRDDLGLGYEQFAWYPFDELHRDEEISEAKREYELIKEVDPRVRIFLTLGTKSIGKFDKIKVVAPHVDIWCVAIDYYNHFKGTHKSQREAIFEFCRAQKSELWSYENTVRNNEHGPHRLYRLKPWGAVRLGLGGYGFWAYNTWKGDPWKVRDAEGQPKPGAGTERSSVVYSGTTPVSSVRWEALREGLNDVKYIDVLRSAIAAAKQAGRDAVAIGQAEALIDEALKSVTEDDVSKPEAPDVYRERMVAMILRLESSR